MSDLNPIQKNLPDLTSIQVVGLLTDIRDILLARESTLTIQGLVGQTEAARMLGVSDKTLKRWALTGRLKSFRSPSGRIRFRLSDVEELLKPIRDPSARKA